MIYIGTMAAIIVLILYAYWFGEWHTKNKLEPLLYKDRLTKLYNRNYLEDHKNDFGDCYITIIDIDDLKHTNDILGHEMGDVRIKYTAAILVLFEGIAIRLGGDEFLLITEEYPEEIEQFLKFSSFGVVHKRMNISLSDAMREADKKMYINKEAA